MRIFSDDDFPTLLTLNFFVIAEVMRPQVVLIHERGATDRTDDPDTVFEGFLVDTPEVFFERVLAVEVLVAAAELAPEMEEAISNELKFQFH